MAVVDDHLGSKRPSGVIIDAACTWVDQREKAQSASVGERESWRAELTVCHVLSDGEDNTSGLA